MGFKELMKSAATEASELVKKEMEKKDIERQQAQRISQHTSVELTVKSGPSGYNGHCTMRQRPEDGMVYFNSDESQLFELIEYSWNGPIYGSASESQSAGSTSTQTVKKGKSGRMAAGALVGSMIFPGVGTVVGAAIGASGKSKSKSQGTSSSTSKTISQKVEQPGVAILKLRKIDNGTILPLTIVCNSEIDAMIRCFQIVSAPSVSEMSKETTDALKGIKALKELLDMGAITQEEFEAKKKQLLNL